MANISTSATTLVPSQDENVLNGYKATYTQYGTTLLRSNAGQVEFLFSTTGTRSGLDTIQIQVALQRPFSQGHLWINSTDPFAPPIIDPAYLSHPADMVLLRQGLKTARSIGTTAPLSSFIVEEITPGPNVTLDGDIENWMRGDAHTEYVFLIPNISELGRRLTLSSRFADFTRRALARCSLRIWVVSSTPSSAYTISPTSVSSTRPSSPSSGLLT